MANNFYVLLEQIYHSIYIIRQFQLSKDKQPWSVDQNLKESLFCTLLWETKLDQRAFPLLNNAVLQNKLSFMVTAKQELNPVCASHDEKFVCLTST